MENFIANTIRNKLFLSSEFFTNSHWLFKISWIESIKGKKAASIKRALKSHLIESVKAELDGAPLPKLRDGSLKQILERANNAKTMAEIGAPVQSRHESVNGHRPVIGFMVGEVLIGIDYFPALLFEPGLKFYTNGKDDMLIIKKHNEIVGMIMPLRQ